MPLRIKGALFGITGKNDLEFRGSPIHNRVMWSYCAVLFSLFLLTPSSWGVNLLKEKIWKIGTEKKSVYLARGIFHSGASSTSSSQLRAMRKSYSPAEKRERIVFEFNTSTPPRVFGHLSDSEQRIYVDFFNTTILPNVRFRPESRYVGDMNFFSDEDGHLSLEMKLKSSVRAEIFSLNSVGRLVIDIKDENSF